MLVRRSEVLSSKKRLYYYLFVLKYYLLLFMIIIIIIIIYIKNIKNIYIYIFNNNELVVKINQMNTNKSQSHHGRSFSPKFIFVFCE